MIFKDYIRKRLSEFLNVFKAAKVVFDSDSHAHVHTVDILPHSLLERDDVFDWLDSFIMESIDVFPNELICIKNKNSIIPYSGQGIEIEGLEYEPISRCSNQASVVSEFTSFVSGSVMQSPIISIIDNNENKPYPTITIEKSIIFSPQPTNNQLAA